MAVQFAAVHPVWRHSEDVVLSIRFQVNFGFAPAGTS